MQKSTATKLIDSERRHSRSRDSDAIIARRAERAYLSVGAMFVGISVIDLIDSFVSDKLTPFRVSFSLIILCIGVAFSFQGYRFRRARRLLPDAKTD